MRIMLLLGILAVKLSAIVANKGVPLSSVKYDALGSKLLSELRDDVKLDVSMAKDYENLRSEITAYRDRLDEIAKETRRSRANISCRKLGGACVNYKLCSGFLFLADIHGCSSDKNKVCCFVESLKNTKEQLETRLPQEKRKERVSWELRENIGNKGILAVPIDVEQLKLDKKYNLKENNLSAQDTEDDKNHETIIVEYETESSNEDSRKDNRLDDDFQSPLTPRSHLIASHTYIKLNADKSS